MRPVTVEMRHELILITLTLLMTVHSGKAQDNVLDSINFRSIPGLYAYGGIGPAIPIGAFGKERKSGFDVNTAMEYRYKSGMLVRGMFDFSSFQFDLGTISQESNGKVYKIGGSNNLISLIGSVGYYHKVGRFVPYGFFGVGASFVSIPHVDIDETSNSIDTSLIISGYFSSVTGAGIDYILNPINDSAGKKNKSILILYAESFLTYIPGQTEASVYKFNLVSINVGLKSKF